MARLPRFTIPGQPQHVIVRGNNPAHVKVVVASLMQPMTEYCCPQNAT